MYDSHLHGSPLGEVVLVRPEHISIVCSLQLADEGNGVPSLWLSHTHQENRDLNLECLPCN